MYVATSGWYGGWWGWATGGGYVPPVYSVPAPCDPCIKAELDCAAGFSPGLTCGFGVSRVVLC